MHTYDRRGTHKRDRLENIRRENEIDFRVSLTAERIENRGSRSVDRRGREAYLGKSWNVDCAGGYDKIRLIWANLGMLTALADM